MAEIFVADDRPANLRLVNTELAHKVEDLEATNKRLGILLQDLRHANEELAQTCEAMLEGWVRALDMRDHETEGHTQRVTEMSLRLAQAMGIRGSELVAIRRGALLHDIGKIGIPDSILFKPGRLNDEEWKLMRMHPVYARQMLGNINFLMLALHIPYCHHEKWDGTGYPIGLRAQQIPLAARIFAVVDVWDALGSSRPYKNAWPESEVRKHIRQESGIHFDPEVVESFMRMVSQRDGDSEGRFDGNDFDC